MRDNQSILDRIAEDLVGMFVLYGIFWALAKVYHAILWLAGIALIAVNETLIFIVRPIVRLFRKKPKIQTLPNVIVRIPIIERMDQEQDFYEDFRRDTEFVRVIQTQKMLPESKKRF